jgi:thioredoxin-like negative regulator of GroEL
VGAGKKPLLVFFSSARSGPCRRLESVLAHLAHKERDRLSVAIIDVGEQEGVAAHFGIRAVPTVVLVRDKREVCRLEGRLSAARIEAALEDHLAARAAG